MLPEHFWVEIQSVCVAHTLLHVSHPLGHSWLPSDRLLKEHWLCSKQQSPAARGGAPGPLAPPTLGSLSGWLCEGLCMSSQRLWVCMCKFPVVSGKHYWSFCPLFWNHPGPKKRGRGTGFPFRAEYFPVMYFLHPDQLWGLVLIVIYSKKKLLYWE